jgi:hypothetical protein
MKLSREIPVCLAAALILLPAFASRASASSWSNQPAWAQGTGNGGGETRTARASSRRVLKEDVPAPFAPGSNNLALDVGQIFLLGNLGAKYNDSIGSRLHYTYGVSDMFGFDASLGYSNHSDGDLSMTSLLTGLRTNLAWYDRVIPYAVVGLGFYKPSMRIPGTETTVSPVLFGMHFGPGVDLQLTDQFFFGASLNFHDMFGSNEKTATGIIDVDGTYTSFYMRAGMSF